MSYMVLPLNFGTPYLGLSFLLFVPGFSRRMAEVPAAASLACAQGWD